MLPYFYVPALHGSQSEIVLDEDNSRHVIRVLRMRPGEPLLLTDGKGALVTAALVDDHKKKCLVKVQSLTHVPPADKKVAVAISPVKNAARFEWFLEKAAEIGVSEIVPLLCDRTERQQLRSDRLHHILVSAMLQSQQAWLPDLRPPTAFPKLAAAVEYERRLIALLGENTLPRPPGPDPRPTIILIGPEGDFTPEETRTAIHNKFVPVSLGKNRLRTETAGVVAATLLCIG